MSGFVVVGLVAGKRRWASFLLFKVLCASTIGILRCAGFCPAYTSCRAPLRAIYLIKYGSLLLPRTNVRAHKHTGATVMGGSAAAAAAACMEALFAAVPTHSWQQLCAALCTLTCKRAADDGEKELLVGCVKLRWPLSARSAELYHGIVAAQVRESLRGSTEVLPVPDASGGMDTQMADAMAGETADAADAADSNVSRALHLPLSAEEVYELIQAVKLSASRAAEDGAAAHIACINGVYIGLDEFARILEYLRMWVHTVLSSRNDKGGVKPGGEGTGGDTDTASAISRSSQADALKRIKEVSFSKLNPNIPGP